MSFEKYKAECDVCIIDNSIRETLCPVCLAQRVMKGKWKLVIIWLLRDGEKRFSELKKSIPTITQAYLSSQLKDLESDNLVIRKSYNEVPPRVEYRLTEDGTSLIPVLKSMSAWGFDYLTNQIIRSNTEA